MGKICYNKKEEKLRALGEGACPLARKRKTWDRVFFRAGGKINFSGPVLGWGFF